MSDNPYLIGGRCGIHLLPFQIREERTEDGGMIVSFFCPECGRVATAPFTASELLAWHSRRKRVERPTVDPSRFPDMREQPLRSQWRVYRGPGDATLAEAEPAEHVTGGNE